MLALFRFETTEWVAPIVDISYVLFITPTTSQFEKSKKKSRENNWGSITGISCHDCEG